MWRTEGRVANCRGTGPRRIIARLNFLHKSRNGTPLLRKRTEEDVEESGRTEGSERRNWQDSKLSADRWEYNGY
ncbi:unnamed protein product [Lasius platythorax]|uniref:Uncharacterized protein n=1 Tax=Lasius platythorax TaxID=488582 RepID=A0AAV2P426_9HYME